jgi:CubicO group peptidase (beta-lactamase class C family)
MSTVDDLDHALERLDAYAVRLMAAHSTPGLSIGLTDRERLLAVRTYGYADVAARLPVTLDTLFETGSIGKSFTAIALLQLHEAGRVDLHAPVTRYLPWFAVRSEYQPITPHDLLSHTAGIITGTDFAPDPRFEVWALRETHTSAPPGTQFHYSNVGYKTLGLVLEAITGQAYADIITAGILGPLGMADTAPAITHETRKRLAVGYRRWFDDRPGSPTDPLVPETWLETDTADGCLAATPADMTAYLRMFLNRGRGPHGHIISEESFARMTQRVIARDEAASTYYGYGLVTWEHEGRRFFSHGGGMPGYYAYMIGDLDRGVGAIATINGPGDQAAVARYAVALLGAARHGGPIPEAPPIADRAHVDNATDLAGSYRSDGRSLILIADGNRLYAQRGGERIPLEARGDDTVYTDHPDFARFALHAQREATDGDAPGRVIAMTHGGDWYVREGMQAPPIPDHPPEWAAYAGHYRTHNPWTTNFRVVLRRGRLVLIFPDEPDGFSDESPLVPLPDGSFRVGEDERGPERIRFDTVVDGQALRAILSGCDYYRFFTD